MQYPRVTALESVSRRDVLRIEQAVIKVCSRPIDMNFKKSRAYANIYYGDTRLILDYANPNFSQSCVLSCLICSHSSRKSHVAERDPVDIDRAQLCEIAVRKRDDTQATRTRDISRAIEKYDIDSPLSIWVTCSCILLLTREFNIHGSKRIQTIGSLLTSLVFHRCL